MKIKINYEDGKSTTQVSEHECGVAPQVGDLVEAKDPDGVYFEGKVVSRSFDFKEEGVATLRVNVSPIQSKQ